MKKVLTVLAIIALTGSIAANAAESRLENFVNKQLSPITQKEKEFNEKMEAQQEANEAKQAEYKKQQEARQAALEKQRQEAQAKREARQEAFEKQKQEAQARREARKDAIQAEKDYWNSVLKK